AGPRDPPAAGALCTRVQAGDGPGATSKSVVAAARARRAPPRAVRSEHLGNGTAHGLRRPGPLHPPLQASLPHHTGRPDASVAVLSRMKLQGAHALRSLISITLSGALTTPTVGPSLITPRLPAVRALVLSDQAVRLLTLQYRSFH